METVIDKKHHYKGSEITWDIIAGIFVLAGLAFIVIGIVGYSLNVVPSDNWVILSQDAWLTNWSHIGYFYWGLILFAVGIIILLISLAFFAKIYDRNYDKVQRRQQRMATINDGDVKPAVEEIEKKEDVAK